VTGSGSTLPGSGGGGRGLFGSDMGLVGAFGNFDDETFGPLLDFWKIEKISVEYQRLGYREI
jgi:hypothetical protein